MIHHYGKLPYHILFEYVLQICFCNRNKILQGLKYQKNSLLFNDFVRFDLFQLVKQCFFHFGVCNGIVLDKRYKHSLFPFGIPPIFQTILQNCRTSWKLQRSVIKRNYCRNFSGTENDISLS